MSFPIVAVSPPMPDDLYIEDARYLSTREIVRTYGYVRDYVARLCRQDKVRGRQLGKLWYVDIESFAAFVRDQAHDPTLSPNPQDPFSKPAL